MSIDEGLENQENPQQEKKFKQWTGSQVVTLLAHSLSYDIYSVVDKDDDYACTEWDLVQASAMFLNKMNSQSLSHTHTNTTVFLGDDIMLGSNSINSFSLSLSLTYKVPLRDMQ